MRTSATDCRPHGFLVPAAVEAVSATRHRVDSLVRSWQLGFSVDRLADVRLLTSELVANAIIHADAPCVVCLRWTGARVRVEVTDTSPIAPRPTEAGTDEECGRGLALVAALSDAWGLSLDPAGKTIWFEIAPDPPAGSGQAQVSGPAHATPSVR